MKTMQWLSVLCSLTFLAIAVFGFVGMSADHTHGRAGCLAAAAQGWAPCEKTAPIEDALYHINAYRSFSQASLVDPLLISLLLLAAGWLARRTHWPQLRLAGPPLRARAHPQACSDHTSRDQLRGWLTTFATHAPTGA